LRSRERLRERGEDAQVGAPGAQKRLLEGVFGVVQRAEHPVAVDVELPPVRLGQAAEGRLVARACGFDERGFGRRCLRARPAALDLREPGSPCVRG
jgi:hypothetical protein